MVEVGLEEVAAGAEVGPGEVAGEVVDVVGVVEVGPAEVGQVEVGPAEVEPEEGGAAVRVAVALAEEAAVRVVVGEAGGAAPLARQVLTGIIPAALLLCVTLRRLLSRIRFARRATCRA